MRRATDKYVSWFPLFQLDEKKKKRTDRGTVALKDMQMHAGSHGIGSTRICMLDCFSTFLRTDWLPPWKNIGPAKNIFLRGNLLYILLYISRLFSRFLSADEGHACDLHPTAKTSSSQSARPHHRREREIVSVQNVTN